MCPSTVPNVRYTSGASEPSHQSGSTSPADAGSSRKRTVVGNGDGSSDAGKRVRYGEARSSSVRPGRCASRAGAATSIDPASACASEIATCAVGMPRPARDHRRRVLARIAQHQIRRPVGEDRLHARQHRGRRQPTEELAVPEHRRFERRRDRKPLPDRGHLLLGRLTAVGERVARAFDHLAHRRRTDDQDLVAAPLRRGEERQQRIQVSGTTERHRRQHPHARRAYEPRRR